MEILTLIGISLFIFAVCLALAFTRFTYNISSAILVFSIFTFLACDFKENEKDHTENWVKFYKETVSSVFVLPAETKVIKAIEYPDSFAFEIQFELPKSKSPEEWIKKIVLDSKINPEFKKNKFLYECSEDCLDIKLQYFPDKDIYLAEHALD